MLIILAGLLAGFIGGLRIFWDDFRYGSFYGSDIMGLGLLTLFGGLIGFGVSFAAYFMMGGGECTPNPQQALVSLNTAAGVDGNFFLGSGYVGSDLYYYYFTQEADGHYQSHAVNGDNVRVYEQGTDAYVVTYHANPPAVTDHLSPDYGGWSCNEDIHVPTGSVQHNSYQVHP